MNQKQINHARKILVSIVATAALAQPFSILAQTKITAPKNKYRLEDDVQAGRQASQEVEKQLPLLRDETVRAYVESVGRRLVYAIPSEFQHSEFQYSFKVVDAKEINAFALPGGPMYVNRGMIEAAKTEGEMAGVIAHEISHVALRHGTAQATKAAKYQWGAIAGAIAGAVIGGGVGEVVSQGSQIGIGAYFLRFSREYETQADILGAQIMARSGYDPRELANMFQTIERQGGGSGPQFLSDHPNPKNRYERINQEARMLRINYSAANRDTREFDRIHERLGSIPRTTATDRRPGNTGGTSSGRISDRVDYPSSRLRTFSGSVFRLSYPDNWRELPEQDSQAIWFAPDGGYGNANGQRVYTHGVNVGTARVQSTDLRSATDEFVRALEASSRDLRRQSDFRRTNISGRDALSMTFTNTNEATGRQEDVNVYTLMLRNGSLFYLITVAPGNDRQSFQRAFQDVFRSIEIRD
jgi:predicted Zn-dependent protease